MPSSPKETGDVCAEFSSFLPKNGDVCAEVSLSGRVYHGVYIVCQDGYTTGVHRVVYTQCIAGEVYIGWCIPGYSLGGVHRVVYTGV